MSHWPVAPTEEEWKDRRGDRWDVCIEWGVVDGRAEPIKISVSSPHNRSHAPVKPVTAEVLRQIPLPRIIKEQRAAQARLSSELSAHVKRLSKPGADVALRHAEEFESNRVLTPDLLRRVAAAYLTARAAGEPTTRAVADATYCAPSTAGKRIMAARRAGLLTPPLRELKEGAGR